MRKKSRKVVKRHSMAGEICPDRVCFFFFFLASLHPLQLCGLFSEKGEAKNTELVLCCLRVQVRFLWNKGNKGRQPIVIYVIIKLPVNEDHTGS